MNRLHLYKWLPSAEQLPCTRLQFTNWYFHPTYRQHPYKNYVSTIKKKTLPWKLTLPLKKFNSQIVIGKWEGRKMSLGWCTIPEINNLITQYTYFIFTHSSHGLNLDMLKTKGPISKLNGVRLIIHFNPGATWLFLHTFFLFSAIQTFSQRWLLPAAA